MIDFSRICWFLNAIGATNGVHDQIKSCRLKCRTIMLLVGVCDAK